MSTSPTPPTARAAASTGCSGWADDFMSWFLYGHETWLVAVLKGVPLFLFVYFMLTYVPNYVYYLITVEIPFLRFSDDFGFLVANGVAGGNFALLVILAIGIQAARGRRGVRLVRDPHLRAAELPGRRAAASSRCSPSTWPAARSGRCASPSSRLPSG